MGEGRKILDQQAQDVELYNKDEFDDDGRPKRTGTVWTASAHIITAVIGSGVLSLAWAMAQLGWIVGPVALLLFSVVTFYTSSLLTDCYRTPDPVYGKRNYTYRNAVQSNLGATKVWFCGICQYVILVGTAIGYTITASISAAALSKSSCFHKKGHKADCAVADSLYMMGFGIIQVLFSQLPNFHDLWWLSILAAVMSLAYSFIAIGLSIAQIISGSTGKTTISGAVVGVDVTSAQKIWNSCQALGDIAFAYSYAMILIEIQDTLKSPPAENKAMKKASFIGVSTTTTFYVLCGCLGYAAFGNNAPGNILTGFGFYEPFWLIDIGNLCIIIHLIGAYQQWSRGYPKGIQTWRTSFVIICTLVAILMPFFNDILAFLGAVGFWPLTVYFPIEMYMSQKKIQRRSGKGIVLQSLSGLCLLVSLAAAVGSIEGVVNSLGNYTPFQTKS